MIKALSAVAWTRRERVRMVAADSGIQQPAFTHRAPVESVAVVQVECIPRPRLQCFHAASQSVDERVAAVVEQAARG